MTSYKIGFQSLTEEIATTKLTVLGQLPQWLQGTLYRNGPAKFEAGLEKMNHWFDGFAMIHRFYFDQTGIYYTNKFLQSDAYNAAILKNKICYD